MWFQSRSSVALCDFSHTFICCVVWFQSSSSFYLKILWIFICCVLPVITICYVILVIIFSCVVLFQSWSSVALCDFSDHNFLRCMHHHVLRCLSSVINVCYVHRGHLLLHVIQVPIIRYVVWLQSSSCVTLLDSCHHRLLSSSSSFVTVCDYGHHTLCDYSHHHVLRCLFPVIIVC